MTGSRAKKDGRRILYADSMVASTNVLTHTTHVLRAFFEILTVAGFKFESLSLGVGPSILF